MAMSRIRINPRTKKEFLALFDTLGTSQEVLEKFWNIAKEWRCNTGDDETAVAIEAARIWADPDSLEFLMVYDSVHEDSLRLDTELDHYHWAGMSFKSLAFHSGKYQFLLCRDFINSIEMKAGHGSWHGSSMEPC